MPYGALSYYRPFSEPPKVGRPGRGNRAKVKAARKARHR